MLRIARSSSIVLRPFTGALALVVLLPALAPGVVRAQEAPAFEIPTTLLVDRSMSLRATASTFEAVARGLFAIEDRYLPFELGEGTGTGGFLVGLYRLGRLSLVDNPIILLHAVARHEIAGHGGRVRQLGGDVLGYRFALPPPYGDGGGSTRFRIVDPEPQELAMTAAGGLESAHLDQLSLEERWVARGRMDFREALQYMTLVGEIAGYIASAGDGPPGEGHDIENYLALVNASYPGTFEPGEVPGTYSDDPVTASGLQDAAGVELLSPALFYSLYSVFWRYLIRGESDAAVPGFELGSLRALPSLHVRLTPFGREFSGGVLTAWDDRIVGARLRLGHGPWGSFRGVELVSRRLFNTGRIQVDADGGVWRQFALGVDSVDPRWGVIATARGVVSFADLPVSAVGELGLKSEGYVPGEDLAGGPIFRLGIAARF